MQTFTVYIVGEPASAAALEATVKSVEVSGLNASSVIVEVEPTRPPNLETDFAVMINAGVELSPSFAKTVRQTILDHSEADLIYSDSLSRTPDGLQAETNLRPGFSPERLEAQNYLGDVLIVSTTLLANVPDLFCVPGELLPQSCAAQICDLARSVVHIPQVLYAQQRFASDLGHSKVEAAAAEGAVSIVIPTIGSERVVNETFWVDRLDSFGIEVDWGSGAPTPLAALAVQSVVKRSTYSNYEFVIVLGEPVRPTLRTDLEKAADGQPIKFVERPGKFNFSNSANWGAVHSEGDTVIFLNDDTVVLTPEWIERQQTYAQRPDIGAVGAKLFYANGTVQHAGIWSRAGFPVHRYEGFSGTDPGYMNSLDVPQNCMAVTGACLSVEKTKFDSAGGFTPRFASSYNDVDLCIKLDALGHRTVWDPHAQLIHLEASSRDPTISAWENATLQQSWGAKLHNDVYDNPNHTAELSDEYPPPKKTLASEPGVHNPREWLNPNTTPAANSSVGSAQ